MALDIYFRRSTGNFGGISNGNAEAEQTLNQLLACMDGLDTSNDGVLVIGATNRYNLLDDALVTIRAIYPRYLEICKCDGYFFLSPYPCYD